MSETCKCCGKLIEPVFDDMCQRCEFIWDTQLLKMSKILPGDTDIITLFDLVKKETIKIIHKNED